MPKKQRVYIKPHARAKYKQRLNDDIMALIYFYPKGTSKANEGYCSSHVGLEGADIFDERQLRVVWNCKGLKQATKIVMKKYEQFKGKTIGYNNLFKISHIEKSKYVKITLEIVDK